MEKNRHGFHLINFNHRPLDHGENAWDRQTDRQTHTQNSSNVDQTRRSAVKNILATQFSSKQKNSHGVQQNDTQVASTEKKKITRSGRQFIIRQFGCQTKNILWTPARRRPAGLVYI